MSTRNGSYARIVDAQTISNDNKAKQSPEKAPKSPESSRPSFGGKSTNAMEKKAKRVHNHAPSPHQAPRPHGMGEQGVNWQAHNARHGKLLDSIKSPAQKTRKANIDKKQINPKLIAKAKKSVLTMHAASQDFSKDKGLGR